MYKNLMFTQQLKSNHMLYNIVYHVQIVQLLSCVQKCTSINYVYIIKNRLKTISLAIDPDGKRFISYYTLLLYYLCIWYIDCGCITGKYNTLLQQKYVYIKHISRRDLIVGKIGSFSYYYNLRQKRNYLLKKSSIPNNFSLIKLKKYLTILNIHL